MVNFLIMVNILCNVRTLPIYFELVRLLFLVTFLFSLRTHFFLLFKFDCKLFDPFRVCICVCACVFYCLHFYGLVRELAWKMSRDIRRELFYSIITDMLYLAQSVCLIMAEEGATMLTSLRLWFNHKLYCLPVWCSAKIANHVPLSDS